MGRKRCFESLEERRLLADVGVLASAAPASSIVGASTAAPAPSASVSGGGALDNSPGSTGDGATAAAPQSANSPADAGGTDSPSEYASPGSASTGSPSAGSASTGNAASSANDPTGYATPNSDAAYANEYSPSRTYAYASNDYAPYYSPAQTAALDSLVAALQESSQAARASSLVQQLNPVASATSAAASSGGSAAGGTSPGGSAAFKPSDLVVRSESQLPLATARPALALEQQPDELTHPVALFSPGGEEPGSSRAEAERAAVAAGANAEPSPAAPQFAGPLAGSIVANLELLEHGVDALFERLERWGAEWTSGAGPRRLGQALIAAAGAAAAWEYARARYREADSSRGPYDWRAPRELHLPRRRGPHRRGTQA